MAVDLNLIPAAIVARIAISAMTEEERPSAPWLDTWSYQVDVVDRGSPPVAFDTWQETPMEFFGVEW